MSSFHKSTMAYVELDAFESDRVMHNPLKTPLSLRLKMGHAAAREAAALGRSG